MPHSVFSVKIQKTVLSNLIKFNCEKISFLYHKSFPALKCYYNLCASVSRFLLILTMYWNRMFLKKLPFVKFPPTLDKCVIELVRHGYKYRTRVS